MRKYLGLLLQGEGFLFLSRGGSRLSEAKLENPVFQ